MQKMWCVALKHVHNRCSIPILLCVYYNMNIQLIYYILLFRLLLIENYSDIICEMVSAEDIENGEPGNKVEETGEDMDGRESRPAV